ncbi:ice-binding family protein [Actinomadura fulvescens]|uniref:ice-binding family protein n=2 Tax=Actinomadura fulvescens TaxID=46160 RepID=UPI003978197A
MGASAVVASPAHAYANPNPVNLGAASNYAVLASAGISTTGVTTITGNMGIYPAAASSVTGFGLILDPSGTFSISPTVVGRVYAADYAPPTPANLLTGVNNEVTAYNDAAGRAPADSLNYLAGAVTGPQTLTRGLYKWTTAVTVSGTITLNGGVNDVFIFQVADTLNFTGSANIVLTGGARACNVIWQSANQVTLAGGAQSKGVILGKKAIVGQSGAKLAPGRALAQTAVTMIANTVQAPTC